MCVYDMVYTQTHCCCLPTTFISPSKIQYSSHANRCGSRICVRGGGSRDFVDIAQRSHGGGKNLGLKMGGWGGAAPRAPLDPHLAQHTVNPVADPETSERGGGARYMKYKPPRMTAIFYMTIFYRPGGGHWPPWAPLAPLLIQFPCLHTLWFLSGGKFH